MSVARAMLVAALSPLLMGCPLSSPVVTGGTPQSSDESGVLGEEVFGGQADPLDAGSLDDGSPSDGDAGNDAEVDASVNRRRPVEDVGLEPGPEPDADPPEVDAATPPEQDVAVPVEEDVEPPPVEDVALPPLEDVVPPPEEDAAPVEEDVGFPPEDDVPAPPVEDVALPPLEDVAVPEEDVAVPEEDVAVPEEDVAVPEEDVAVPEEDAEEPEEDVAVPEEDVAVPEEDAAVPEEDVAVPEEDVTLPEEDAEEPEEDVTVPEEDAEEPEEDAAVPEEDAEEPPPDPCASDPCKDFPPVTCDGPVLLEPDGTATCSVDAGVVVCDYAMVETDCGAISAECSLGGCIPVIPAPDVGEVVITEMMPQPELMMDAARWIELRMVADDLRDLGSCSLSDATGSTASIGGELIVDPDEHVVIALGFLDGLVDDFLDPQVVMPGPADPGGLDLMAEGPEPLRFVCGDVVVDEVDLEMVGGAENVVPAPGHAWQLSAGSITALANDDADNWCSAYLPFGFNSLGTPGIENFGCDTTVDYCRYWEPAIETVTVGKYFLAYVHIDENGLTEKTKGAPDSIAGLQAQIGYGPDGEIPLSAPEQFEWFDAVPVPSSQNFIPSDHDRWRASLIIYLPGIYDVAGRFTLDGGFSWLYCDLDGSGNGYSPDQSGNVFISD